LVQPLKASSMSHIIAFILGMSVATYGVGETVAQMEKAWRTVQVAVQDKLPMPEKR
jgi:hypothetical protein